MPAGEAEQVTVVKEVVVSDNEMINKLTAENQKLKVRLLKVKYVHHSS